LPGTHFQMAYGFDCRFCLARGATRSSSFRVPPGDASALAYHCRDDVDRPGERLLDGLSRDRLLNPVAIVLAGVVLVAAYAAPYLLQPIEGDLARDLYHGYRISSGLEWPTAGPKIGEGWHLGPAWYYLLALLLLIVRSIAGAVATVGLLAALKFPLAYVLGREWVDTRFGIAWAILLALPGVATFESIWVAHPSLTAAASLAVVFALWRAVERRSYPWMYAACLGFGLALHAHPTALPLGLLLALAFARMGPWGAKQAGAAVVCAALVLAPFAPLLADAPTQAREFAEFSQGVAAASGAFRLRDILPVAANIGWHVPNLVVDTFLGDSRALSSGWRIFLGVLHAIVLAGIVLSLARPVLGLRRLAVAALAFTMFSAIVVVAVRGETRFYMVYALAPAIALVQAIGLRAFARSGWPGAGPLAGGLLAGVVVAFAAVAGARFVEAAQGHVRLPALFGAQMDLRIGPKTGYAELDSLPLWDLDALGRALCDAGSVRAYGDLAIVVDSQFNVPARIHCGERAHVVLGGAPGPGDEALYMLRADAVGDGSPTRRYGALRLGDVASIPVPGRGVEVASGSTYPARPLCAPASLHTIEFTAATAGALVIATALPAQCPITLRRVTANGRDVEATRHLLSYFVHPPEPGAETKWRLEIETGDPGAVQVFTLR